MGANIGTTVTAWQMCIRDRYKNMIKGLTVNRINQLWVADITYIDTDEGVAYLHLLTDAFTHEIIDVYKRQGQRLSDGSDHLELG